METKRTCLGLVKGGNCEELTKSNQTKPKPVLVKWMDIKKEEEDIGLGKKKPIRFRENRKFMIILNFHQRTESTNYFLMTNLY